MLVGAGTDEVEQRRILRGTLVHQARHLHLVHALGNLGEFAVAQRGGDFVEQRVQARHADAGKHGGDVGFGMGNERHKAVGSR